ncbi:MAG: VOC family protein [Chitinophagaceae bacterium]|nr:MAG: VOC family protein [Chitinophagaceae bacterium]
MQTHALPYLNFAGEAREALEFYKSCFGGETQIMPIGGSPMEGQFPAEKHGHVLHGQLNAGAFVVMASDMTPGPLQAGNNFGIVVACATEDECRGYWEKLSAGGHIYDPLGMKFWGALSGTCTDRFGVRWMVGWDPKTAQ